MTLGVEFRVPALAEALYHPAWAGLLFQPTSLCPISCLPLSRPRDLFAIPWIRPATLSFNLCLCGSFYQDGVPQIAPWPPSSLLSGVCSPLGRRPPFPSSPRCDPAIPPFCPLVWPYFPSQGVCYIFGSFVSLNSRRARLSLFCHHCISGPQNCSQHIIVGLAYIFDEWMNK